MKILIYSPAFHPSVGGIETIVGICAEEFAALGHEVKVVCQTPDSGDKVFPFEVLRRPSPAAFFRTVGWCDIFFQACVSLKGLWPLLFLRRHFVVCHHTWYSRADGSRGLRDRLKYMVSRFGVNISVSRAVAASFSTPQTVIPNAYDDGLFRLLPGIARDVELAFLGRLVADKGVEMLIRALALLGERGLRPKLTIIGDGVEAPRLKQLVRERGLSNQVIFAGRQTGESLVTLLNRHVMLVVPSLWAEPFGIVALEGMACGCVVVGSEQGGLAEAIGKAGRTFPNGDVTALADTLQELVQSPGEISRLRAAAPSHLENHTKRAVARTYLDLFEKILEH